MATDNIYEVKEVRLSFMEKPKIGFYVAIAADPFGGWSAYYKQVNEIPQPEDWDLLIASGSKIPEHRAVKIFSQITNGKYKS